MSTLFERKKILIFGMTYPQLSTKYVETVCTAGVLEDGTPVRLYPIPYRYLDGKHRFHKYQWIEVDIEKSTSDPRPESYKVKTDTIRLLERIPSNARDGWSDRAVHVFKSQSWQFDSMKELWDANVRSNISLGVIRPKEILDIKIIPASGENVSTFRRRLETVEAKQEIGAAQTQMFVEDTLDELLDLELIESRLQVHWKCNSKECGGLHSVHKMQVIDWELMELQRKVGIEKAYESLLQKIDPDEMDIRFFLGNTRHHQRNFTIGGLWYPKIPRSPTLF